MERAPAAPGRAMAPVPRASRAASALLPLLLLLAAGRPAAGLLARLRPGGGGDGGNATAAAASSAASAGGGGGGGAAAAAAGIRPDGVVRVLLGEHSRKTDGPPCGCQPSSPDWKVPAPRAPTCLFFDLGAADGETYKVFLHQSSKWSFDYNAGPYGHSQCFAYLIEANPGFSRVLEPLRTDHVYPIVGVAAYMCDKASEIFHLDLQGPQGWGSSLNSSHGAVAQTSTPVEVRIDNLMRLLTENAIAEDTVVVKMDIEGAEFDILPCLANSPAASLIDALYVETHCNPAANWCPSTGQAGNTLDQYEAATNSLRKRGVYIPQNYNSPM